MTALGRRCFLLIASVPKFAQVLNSVLTPLRATVS